MAQPRGALDVGSDRAGLPPTLRVDTRGLRAGWMCPPGGLAGFAWAGQGGWMQLKPLSEQVVVVFGASSGIGRATALKASAAGARVVAAARGRQALDSLAAQGGPGEIVVAVADARDPAQVAAVAALAVARFGRIDTWAHVAGVVVYGRFVDHTPEEFRQVVEVDLLGAVHGAMAALPHLRAHGGALVIVSSEIAKRAFPLAAAYSAAKHGVNGFIEALRVELRHEHAPVSLTEIQPAAISSPFFEHALTRLGVRPSGPPPVYSPEKVADAILDAAQHPRHTVVVGGAAKVQVVLQRVSPRLMDAFLPRNRVLAAEVPGPQEPHRHQQPVRTRRGR